MKEEFDIVDYSGNELINMGEFTHIIQHLHPSKWARYGTMEHIGWLDFTADNDLENLCMVDQIWAPTSKILSSVSQGDIFHVEHVCDSVIYEKIYDFQEIPEIRGTFPFFLSSIGQNDRMQIESVVQAFWEEFDPTEPVSLILNCGPFADKLVESVKNRINLYDNIVYQRIILIDHKLSNEQELGIVQNIVKCNINVTDNWSAINRHCKEFDIPTLYFSKDEIDTYQYDMKSFMRYHYINQTKENSQSPDIDHKQKFIENIKDLLQ
jgi:hypothetical protein